MLENCLFIAGTDTEVGKTMISSALIAYWRHFLSHSPLGVIKLMQTGIGDRQWYEKFCDEDTRLVVPLEYETPVAPPVAALLEDRDIDLDLVRRSLVELAEEQEFVIAESLGSLGSPVTDDLVVADLAGRWQIPTVLVVPVKLGSIGQTVGQVSLARERHVKLQGMILSCGTPDVEAEIEKLSPPATLEKFTKIPVIGTLPYVKDWGDRQFLANTVASWNLKALLPPKVFELTTKI